MPALGGGRSSSRGFVHGQAGVCENAPVHRREPVFDPDGAEHRLRRDEASMLISCRGSQEFRRTVARNQARTSHHTSLGTAHAGGAAEPEQSVAGHYGARLLQDLATQRVHPALTWLGPPARQSPQLAIAADQDDAIRVEADRGRAVHCPWRWVVGWVPHPPPFLIVRADGELDVVLGDLHGTQPDDSDARTLDWCCGPARRWSTSTTAPGCGR
jgi:hypothetical protein